MDSPSGILYFTIVLLLIFSAFFSAAETALSTSSKLRLRKQAEDGDEKAKIAMGLIKDYDKSLFSILVGNNLVNITTSSLATVLATAVMGPTGAVLATVAVTVLVLIFGEILPKAYASDRSEVVALQVAKPLRMAIAVLSPLAWFFMQLKKLLYKVFPPPAKEPTVTEEELIYMIGSIEEEGVLEEQERELVQSALEFDEIAIQEILTPRVNIVALDVDSPVEKIKDTVIQEGYSRIPVFEGSIDSIIGVLYSRDFYTAYIAGGGIDLRAMVGEPLFVPRRMRLSRLLALMKSRKNNLAVVTDDYGGTLGIVTMEDMLEELVGDIWDEDEEIPAGLVRLDDQAVEVAGDRSLEETLKVLGAAEIESDYTTVNGWALHLFERIPLVGESLTAGELAITVLEMHGHRIQRLRVVRTVPSSGKSDK